MFRTEIVEVGDSLGFVLPQELLDVWKVGVGDTIYAVETDAGFQLLPHPLENVDAGTLDAGSSNVGNTKK